MKVILTKDVKGVGRAHETISTSDGYALNYLIPKKLAVSATGGALKEAEQYKKKSDERAAVQAQLIAQNLSSLAEARIVVKAKANEKGHLYNAIGESEIVEAAKREAGVDLPADSIKLEKPIKELGEFDVPVASGEAFGKFKIIVEAE
ncbi:MAG TPA: 50S ribosomal protein L9 [Candidatus Paceibacterota bacterium]|nr:50S ribosomal protein L9 [Candidatus Paceibacterota bacterium]